MVHCAPGKELSRKKCRAFLHIVTQNGDMVLLTQPGNMELGTDTKPIFSSVFGTDFAEKGIVTVPSLLFGGRECSLSTPQVRSEQKSADRRCLVHCAAPVGIQKVSVPPAQSLRKEHSAISLDHAGFTKHPELASPPITFYIAMYTNHPHHRSELEEWSIMDVQI